MRESVIGVSMSEEDITSLVAWQHSNICSDGAGIGPASGHPRGHGAFPRAIHLYVREQKILSIEEMIRKMTALGADHVGIKDRGVIKVGNHADLVLFDLDSITDNATIERPDQLADGIIGVWVNGKRVWQDQAATIRRPGVFVVRSASTP